jgi:hypothetical protein
MKGVIEAKNLMEEGSRPREIASARILAILGRRREGEWEETKIASAWVAPNFEPALFHSSSVFSSGVGV